VKEPEFWEEWKQFEVKHGSVDTVRKMFRVKRSVATRFNSVFPNFVSGQGGPLNAGSAPADKMQALEQRVAAAEDAERPALPAPPKDAPRNIDEIDLDAALDGPKPPPPVEAPGDAPNPVEDESLAELDNVKLTTKAVPKAVFGSAASQLDAEMKKGAKERLKKKQ